MAYVSSTATVQIYEQAEHSWHFLTPAEIDGNMSREGRRRGAGGGHWNFDEIITSERQTVRGCDIEIVKLLYCNVRHWTARMGRCAGKYDRRTKLFSDLSKGALGYPAHC